MHRPVNLTRAGRVARAADLLNVVHLRAGAQQLHPRWPARPWRPTSSYRAKQMKNHSLAATTALAWLLLFPIAASAQPSASTSGASGLRQAAKQSLVACVRTTDNCRTAINHAWAELVFPRIQKADIGIGGQGAKGVLVEAGRITGYYTLAGGSAVPPPNIDGTTAVFTLERDDSVARLKSGAEWTVASAPTVRLITEHTGDVPPTASVEAFIFDRSGLRSGISPGAFNVRKTGVPRSVS